MGSAAEFDKKLKDLLTRLQRQYGSPDGITRGDPLEELLLGILSRDVPESRGRQALQKLKEEMVDFNELRVAAVRDIVDELGRDFPSVRQKAQAITSVLGGIFEKLENLDISFLKNKAKRDARKWLLGLPGADSYSVGRVMLLCFDAHAVPVNEPILAGLKAEGLFDDSVEPAGAQAVLERHIRAQDALQAFYLFHQWAETLALEPAKTAGGSRKAKRPARVKSSRKRSRKKTSTRKRTTSRKK